jgi:hypothetical protein
VIWPIGCLVLGVSLGLSTLGYDDADMRLRVPALLTAFILFSQALLELTPKIRRAARGGEVVVAPVPAQLSSVESKVLTSAEVKLSRGSLPAAAGYPVPEEPKPAGAAPAKRYVPILLILLGLWLGLAVLVCDFYGWLSGLSIVAAFLLFAFGWQDLSGRR